MIVKVAVINFPTKVLKISFNILSYFYILVAAAKYVEVLGP